MQKLIELNEALANAKTGMEATALLVDFWKSGALSQCAERAKLLEDIVELSSQLTLKIKHENQT